MARKAKKKSSKAKTTKTKKKRGRPPKKKVKVRRVRKSVSKSKKEPVVPTFEDIGDFPVKQAIRVRAVPSSQRKINLVLGNLLFFIILFVLSSLLYIVSNGDFYKTLFFLLSLIFGGMSLAFLIALLVLVFLRVLKE
jgi:hypothetical protein